MQASPELKIAYDNVIREYLEKGYISPINCNSSQSSYFIPHHGVIREDKVTTKLRVVLDGSCKTSTGFSLNDLLYRGENLQGSLFNIINNFRLFSIALSADIRQMFLSIGIRESDRRFQRILYRFSPQQPLQVYEFNRVVFGLKSSPFHALRTIKQLAADEGASFPQAREVIDTSLYMDDFVYSVPSEELGISTASEMISLMKAGQFELVKWSSNSQVVLDSIPPSHRLPEVKEFDESNQHKILGLCWSPTSDYFSIKINTPIKTCTKRSILSCVAKIWDVMGFVAPVVLYVKLIIKQLWLCNCDWDDTPPEDIVKLWTRLREELPLLGDIKIPRHIGIVADSVITILAFADASEKAYGGVIYFHVQNRDSNTINLITAKSKVSPKKVVSLARLELCAILLLTQLIKRVVDACQSRVIFRNIFAFSDSTVALCWVHSSPHRWNTFVANRVTKIQNNLAPHNLYHISSTDNPADCLSRDTTLSFEELSTVLAQIESVMNTRPLCSTLSSDPSEPLALTPAHFLNLSPLRYLPAEEIDESLTIVARHNLLDKLIQSFWKRWRRDYLHTLQSRRKWNTPVDPVVVGSVVIIITDNTPPLHWPLGVIEEVFPDSTGVTRVARVRTTTGSYLRPVVRLCPLPKQ
ncbi:uncharacterized protein LOC123722188 [Papilio machaon]|uniref:uncharacterized protein LOC123722188 n=1 Tax=Papilio machaon TaxID=76193 RepID=UPI001E665ABD|nr:uncharacterized protein LOC123722188 [Papilio machaon]